jgi:hypothetical protein
VSLDKQDTCVDVQHKRRGRPRLKDSAPSTTAGASEGWRPAYPRHISADSWKTDTITSYTRDHPRRENSDSHHNRTLSHGSQAVGPRHHPYANPTGAPTSAYGNKARRPSAGYFDIPLQSHNLGSQSRAYPPQRGPNSPTHYPYSSQLNAPPQNDTIASPVSPYHLSPLTRPDAQPSGDATQQHLLPRPEVRHPGLMRRGSFPSIVHQSEHGESPQRPPIFRTGSGPPTEYPGRDPKRHQEGNDSVKLPSLKDLGVPFR